MDSKEQKEIICYCWIRSGCYFVNFGKYVRNLITGKIEFSRIIDVKGFIAIRSFIKKKVLT